MAKQRIWDVWGGSSKDWSESLTPQLVFRAVAVLVAVPLSAIGFAIADNPHTPSAARMLIAPGFVMALHLPFDSGRFPVDLGRFAMTALFVDFVYYILLLFAAERVFRRKKTITND